MWSGTFWEIQVILQRLADGPHIDPHSAPLPWHHTAIWWRPVTFLIIQTTVRLTGSARGGRPFLGGVTKFLERLLQSQNVICFTYDTSAALSVPIVHCWHRERSRARFLGGASMLTVALNGDPPRSLAEDVNRWRIESPKQASHTARCRHPLHQPQQSHRRRRDVPVLQVRHDHLRGTFARLSFRMAPTDVSVAAVGGDSIWVTRQPTHGAERRR